MLVAAALMATSLVGFAQQKAEKQLVVTITSEQLKGGVVSEIMWDNGTIMLQGVFANPDGTLAAQYFVKPANGITLEHRDAPTQASAKYWETKAKPISPTGLGRITTAQDAKMPMYGIASQEQRMYDATEMGGTQVQHTLRIGKLVLHERRSKVPPYDGEVWSWSPAELNRVAYVDGSGDLWIAHADGRNPERLLKGNFTLPAWSDDGRLIAVAERKQDGRKWEISVVRIPQELLR